MTDRKCEGKKWPRDSMRPWPCGLKAKVEREGHWFCGTHDPIAVAKKDEARNAKGRAAADQRMEIWRLNGAASDLLSAARNCIVPLEWARDNMDQIFAPKVQRNIDAIKAAIAKAEGTTP